MSMIVSRSLTLHRQSPPLTIVETVLKESDDLDILGVIIDSKVLFRSIIARFPEQLVNDLVCKEVLASIP